MAYGDRLRAAAFRSPNGSTFDLQFDEVVRDGEKKVAIHELPQQDGAQVQDLGNKARRFTFACYFTGDDYDTTADAFDAALTEKGTGALQHPRWGDMAVQVLGWSQTEKLVDGVGRADFEISFIKVDEKIKSPITSAAVAATVATNSAIAKAASIKRAATGFAPHFAADIAKCKAQVLGYLNGYTQAFAVVTSWSDEIQAGAAALVTTITNSIDRLIASPAELFTSLSTLAEYPAHVFGSIPSKIAAYADMVATTAAHVPESYSEAVSTVEGLFYALAGTAVASSEGTMTTRAEAVTAAETMDSIAETIEAAVETIEAAVDGFRADPEMLAALADIMAQAKADILDRSYSLKIERRVTLTTERTPLDLVVEFNGADLVDLDAAVDDFAATNKLQGDELIVVPTGREVVYYVG